jgi:hypothetical protein
MKSFPLNTFGLCTALSPLAVSVGLTEIEQEVAISENCLFGQSKSRGIPADWSSYLNFAITFRQFPLSLPLVIICNKGF